MRRVSFVIVFVVLFINGGDACFGNDTYSECSYPSESNFYKECITNSIGHNTETLLWLDSQGNQIGPARPGNKPQVYTEVDPRRGVLSLHMANLSKSLAGYYKCIEELDGAKRTLHTVKLDVYDKMIFYETPKTQYMIKGRESLVKCQARGETPPRIAWQILNNDLKEIFIDEINNNDKYEIVPKGLVVKEVTNEDEGLYRCVARVESTSEDDELPIKVKVLTAPLIDSLEALPNATVVEGESLTLQCNADGFPKVNYVWQKVSKENLPYNTSWIQDNNKINFDNIDETDRGVYQCSAENDAGVDKKQITVEVLTSPIVTQFNNITEKEGSRVQIICKARGRPKPAISITFDANITTEDSGTTLVNYQPKDNEIETYVTIDKITKEHTGSYYCNATNILDSSLEEMYLKVLYEPYFDVKLETSYAWSENPINLTCDYQSDPPSLVYWRLETLTEELHENDKPSDPNLYIPIINDTIDTQIGTYECLAKNNIGTAKKKFIVKKGEVPSTILYANTTDIKATSVTFEVKYPNDSSPEVIGVTAEYDTMENYNITRVHQLRTWAIQWEFKLTKLKPNTSYGIRFAAVNQVGNSPFSEIMTFNTLGRSIPEPVSIDNGNYSVLPNGDMMLRLDTADENEEPVDFYDVKYCPVIDSEDNFIENDCKRFEITPTNELIFPDLTPNTTYVLEILAHNSVGYSKPTTFRLKMPERDAVMAEQGLLSAGAVIGISVVVVVVCIILLDLLLLVTKKQGMIASCFFKKNKKKKVVGTNSRDRKGLLNENKEGSAEEPKRPDNGHKEYEYNKVTGIITGKHSQV